MHEKALQYTEKYLVLRRHDVRSRSVLAAVYAILGKREEALAGLGELKKDFPSSATEGLAVIYAALRDSEQTFAYLEKSYEARDVYLTFLPVLPEFRHLHGDPRFADLLRRIGLPQQRASEIKTGIITVGRDPDDK
jgi:hypothetical protein